MNDLEPAVGVLGGTFDPIHRAHLQLALAARASFGLAEVLVIPAGQPPHRQQPLSSPAHRLAMARLAVADQPGLRVDDGEVLSSEPSYTVTTLLRLRREYGVRRPLALILGADAYLGLAAWHRWRELITLAHIVVAMRPGHALDPAAMNPELREQHVQRIRHEASAIALAPAGAVAGFAMAPLEISATGIRQRLARGERPTEWLAEPVLDYIAHHHLYQ